MLVMVLVSNISYSLSVSFVLSMLKRDEKHMISSFARVRTFMLFSSFLQIVCLVASEAEGYVGGKCTKGEQAIPYLFDVMLGLQTLVLIIYIFEKLFGFGSSPKQPKSEEDKKEEKGKKKGKKDKGAAAKQQKKPAEVRIITLRQDQVAGEKLFR